MTNHPLNKCLLPITLLLLLTLQSAAAEVPPPPKLDREKTLEAAEHVTLEHHPNADAVLLDEQTVTHYNPDGTYVQWHEAYLKILTEEARRNNRTFSSYFTIPYQRGPEDCQIERLEIIKPDGTVVPIDVDAQSRVMTNPQSMDSNIYNPNDRIIQVNVAGLEINDVLYYRLFDRIVHPRMADTWSGYNVLEGTYPILRQKIAIHAPKELPLLAKALLDPVDDTVTYSAEETETGTLHRWEARNVPRMFPEPDMPAAYTVLQRVLAGTSPDWETVSRWYWNLSAPRFTVSPAIREKVAELVEGLESRQERIDALFTFVSQRIRYMGITMEAVSPGYEPREVAETFELRHGVCRDKAALLVVMLREAGFEAFPTLIHSGPKKDFEVPQPYFNHAIVAVREPDGSWLLMDPTDENTTQLLPAYLNDMSYLVATPEGDTLRVSPIVPAGENIMRISTHARLHPSGRLSATTTLDFEGINDNAYRGLFARRNREERARLIEGIVKRTIPDALVHRTSLTPEDMQNTTEPLRIALEYDTDQFVVAGPAYSLLHPPTLGTTIGMANFIIGQTGLDRRKYPMQTRIACGIHENITIELPENLLTDAQFPRYSPFEDDTLAWFCSFSAENEDTIIFSSRFELKNTEFSPEEYLTLKKVLGTIEQDQKKALIIHTPDAHLLAPDARLLDVAVDFTLFDSGAWRQDRSIRREILTYAGKKDHSEFKIDFNPIWDTVEVTRAQVTTADGSLHTVRPEEINIMDAPWAGTAPRYPAGKTMIVSFPAVEPGSIIDFSYSRTYTNRPFFSDSESFRLSDPLGNKTVRLIVPPGISPSMTQTFPEGITASVATNPSDGTVAYTWSAHNIPGVKPEDFLPPWHTFNPSLFLSTGDWAPYAQTINSHLLAASVNQTNAAKLALSLTAPHEDPHEQIKAIRNHIATRIRAVGPSLSRLPLSELTPADQTLADGYGNRADRAILHYAMLEAAGFEPAFILASSEPWIDQILAPRIDTPSRNLFTSVLVRVKNPLDEGYLYLNQGDEYSHLEACEFEDKTALRLPEGTLFRIDPAEKSLETREFTLDVAQDGDVRMLRTVLFHGTHFGSEKKRYSEMQPEDFRRHHLELVAGQSQSAVPDGELIADFSTYPGRVEFAVRIPAYAVSDAPFLYLELPEGLDNLIRLRTTRRTTPYYNAETRRRDIRINLNLPGSAMPEIAPGEIDLATLAGAPIRLLQNSAFSRQPEGMRLEYRAESEIPPAIFLPDRYAELAERLQRLSGPENKNVLLRIRPDNTSSDF